MVGSVGWGGGTLMLWATSVQGQSGQTGGDHAKMPMLHLPRFDAWTGATGMASNATTAPCAEGGGLVELLVEHH